MSLDDFNLLTVIGRGSYAKVLQVEHKATKQIYAMKIIKKEMFNEDEVGYFLPFLSRFYAFAREKERDSTSSVVLLFFVFSCIYQWGVGNEINL